jgi:hypothetical protein
VDTIQQIKKIKTQSLETGQSINAILPQNCASHNWHPPNAEMSVNLKGKVNLQLSL